MDVRMLVERLSETPGIAGAMVVPDDIWHRVCAEEESVKAAGGTMDVESIGMEDCCGRDIRICMLTRPTFEFSDDGSMVMLDEEDHVVGHSIRMSQVDEYRAKENVVFLSKDFVLYTDTPIIGEQRFVMCSIPYRGHGDWIPEDARSVLWFPCSSASGILFEMMGCDVPGDLATGILALDRF